MPARPAIGLILYSACIAAPAESLNDTISNSQSRLQPREWRAIWSLSLIYMIRMIGLFIILPVFSLFGDEYRHGTPLLIGLAIGIYGLLQACLQIPFGMLSDRIGRKKVITLGLLLLCVGSVVAAMSDSIYGVIIGRALQGAGAIAAALMALAADLTRVEMRTRVMAALGASIGAAFVMALVLGPLLLGWFSIDGLFWLTALSSVLAIVMLHWLVPTPARCQYSAETGARPAVMRQLFGHRQLLRLDVSIFMLHLIITAVFFAVPLALREAGMASERQWLAYLPAMLIGFIVMVPLILWAEKRAMRAVMLLCIAGLAGTQLLFAIPGLSGTPAQIIGLYIGIALFFCFMNTLEALLPSLVSRLAPAGSRGSAMGIYSSSQFLGAFVGGAGAGWLYGSVGPGGLFALVALLCLFWMAYLAGFRAPQRMSTHRRALSREEQSRGHSLMAELEALPGVEEVVIALDEGVAYLKVDKARFQQAGGGSGL